MISSSGSFQSELSQLRLLSSIERRNDSQKAIKGPGISFRIKPISKEYIHINHLHYQNPKLPEGTTNPLQQ